MQVVLKKRGMAMVKNDKEELLPTPTVTGERVCTDYRNLNKATRKYHYPLFFLDQMLDRLVGQSHYRFLDGYSGYNQIVVNSKDQERRPSHAHMEHFLSKECLLGYTML